MRAQCASITTGSSLSLEMVVRFNELHHFLVKDQTYYIPWMKFANSDCFSWFCLYITVSSVKWLVSLQFWKSDMLWLKTNTFQNCRFNRNFTLNKESSSSRIRWNDQTEDVSRTYLCSAIEYIDRFRGKSRCDDFLSGRHFCSDCWLSWLHFCWRHKQTNSCNVAKFIVTILWCKLFGVNYVTKSESE